MSIQIIAEAGINHSGSMETAFRLIDAAKEIGANCVKFQKRTVDLCYTPEELAKPRESPFGTTNGDLKRALEFSREQYEQINTYCKVYDIRWTASCWDIPSVECIASFNPPFLKIPSALITDIPLLDAFRKTKIPLIMSTGMSSWEEIDEAMRALSYPVRYTSGVVEYAWNDRITLLHCHSSYPSPLEEINLACINSFKERYPGVKVGYSSHTVSPWPCLMAAVYGAEVIEFHLTLDRSMWGSDQSASLEPHAAKKLVEEIRTFERCKGDGVKRVYPSELPARDKLRKVRSA